MSDEKGKQEGQERPQPEDAVELEDLEAEADFAERVKGGAMGTRGAPGAGSPAF